MEDSRTITLHPADADEFPWQLEVVEPDDDGDMCLIIWFNNAQKGSVYLSRDDARRVAITLLEAAL